MATDSTRATIAQMARVYIAPVGTAAPTNSTVAMAAAWREVGYFTPDSLRFTDDPNFDTVTSHQSNYPIRRFQTSDSAAMQVDLQEFSVQNLIAVLGGGTVTQITAPVPGPPPVPGEYKYSPPAVGGRSSVAACIEVIDGVKRYRIVIPRATQTEAVQMDLRKGNETILPLRLAVEGSDVGDPWYLLTNDPAWSPTAS